MVRNEVSPEELGRVLYRQPPDVRGVRALLLSSVFALPWLLAALFEPGPLTYVLAGLGGILAWVLGYAIDSLIGRRERDAIHERGALVHVGGSARVLWFSSDTLVTEIHEIMREYGEPDDDQWVFEVRSGENIFALSTYLPCSANHIRNALTRALGQPPRLIERH